MTKIPHHVPGKNVARTGKVKVPKWGVILMPYKWPFLIDVHFCRALARLQCDHLNKMYTDSRYKIVRLTGTVSYTVAK